MKTTARFLTLLLIIGATAPQATCAAEADAPPVKLEGVDFSTWRGVPVFHLGRVMPMDTLAKVTLETVCGENSATTAKLGLDSYYTPQQLAESRLQGALELFPEGKTRKMSSEEVLLSWLTETDKWEDVPFILCEHEDLHKVLGISSTTPVGVHRKYVTPRMIAESDALLDYMDDLRDRSTAVESAGGKFEMNETDKKVTELRKRYQIFRRLTHDPRLPLTVSQNTQRGDRDEFLSNLSAVLELMDDKSVQGNSMEDMLYRFVERQEQANADSPVADSARALLVALQQIRVLASRMFPDRSITPPEGVEIPAGPPTLAEAEEAVVFVRRAALRVDNQLTSLKDQVYGEDFADNADVESGQSLFRELAFKADALHRLARQMHISLYDNGSQFRGGGEFRYGASVYVAPALNAAALAKNRASDDQSESWMRIQAEPWLTLACVLYASDDLLYHDEWPVENYNEEHIHAVRAAWKELDAAYTDRANANRAKDCEKAQIKLAAALRTLGEGVEPARRELVEQELPPDQRDEALLAYTQYPSKTRLQPELTYNAVKPFQWAWVICFLSVLAFGMAFGGMRKYAFWAAVAILLLAVAWTTYGFYLRVSVTRWAPVTNMYETVVFVPWVISVLAIWFLLLPLTWTGIRDAWRLTAVPLTWEAASLTDRQHRLLPESGWVVAGVLSAMVRLALMVFTFHFLAIAPYADGGRTIFHLLPTHSPATAGESLNIFGFYIIQLLCLVSLVWFLPRVALMALYSVVTVPVSLVVEKGRVFKEAMPQVYSRKVFGLSGALGACFLLMIAANASSDVLNENFSPLQPVLRSNFWLTVHVLTIVASYGAGLLAWVIGMIALTYYLFGKYRQPVVATNVPKGMQPAHASGSPQRLSKLPPAECSTLAGYAYRAVQVAVLLLAAGTILGGLWADVSWGRFWGWDPKEVWALISLLVYLAILHGRYAGWFNNFGMIFGTVLGAMAIAFSWYGVNFILPMLAPDGMAGLHAYGTGTGGLLQVSIIVGASVAYLIAASIRYRVEMGTLVVPTEHTPEVAEVYSAELAAGEAKPQGA